MSDRALPVTDGKRVLKCPMHKTLRAPNRVVQRIATRKSSSNRRGERATAAMGVRRVDDGQHKVLQILALSEHVVRAIGGTESPALHEDSPRTKAQQRLRRNFEITRGHDGHARQLFGLTAIGRHDGGTRQQCTAKRIDGRLVDESHAVARDHHRVENHSDFPMRNEPSLNRVNDVRATEEAALHGVEAQVVVHRIELRDDEARVDRIDLRDSACILHG